MKYEITAYVRDLEGTLIEISQPHRASHFRVVTDDLAKRGIVQHASATSFEWYPPHRIERVFIQEVLEVKE